MALEPELGRDRSEDYARTKYDHEERVARFGSVHLAIFILAVFAVFFAGFEMGASPCKFAADKVRKAAEAERARLMFNGTPISTPDTFH